MWMCVKKVNTCLCMGSECVFKKWMCMIGMWRYVEKVKGCVKRETVESDGEGNGTPLQYSCLENPMDRGAWWAAVHGVVKSQIRLSNFTFTFHFHALGHNWNDLAAAAAAIESERVWNMKPSVESECV